MTTYLDAPRGHFVRLVRTSCPDKGQDNPVSLETGVRPSLSAGGNVDFSTSPATRQNAETAASHAGIDDAIVSALVGALVADFRRNPPAWLVTDGSPRGPHREAHCRSRRTASRFGSEPEVR